MEGICIVCDGIICLQLKMDEVTVREKVDNLHSVLEDIQSGKVTKYKRHIFFNL